LVDVGVVPNDVDDIVVVDDLDVLVALSVDCEVVVELD